MHGRFTPSPRAKWPVRVFSKNVKFPHPPPPPPLTPPPPPPWLTYPGQCSGNLFSSPSFGYKRNSLSKSIAFFLFCSFPQSKGVWETTFPKQVIWPGSVSPFVGAFWPDGVLLRRSVFFFGFCAPWLFFFSLHPVPCLCFRSDFFLFGYVRGARLSVIFSTLDSGVFEGNNPSFLELSCCFISPSFLYSFLVLVTEDPSLEKATTSSIRLSDYLTPFPFVIASFSF